MKADFGIRCAGAEPLLYELSKPGRTAAILPALDVPEAELPPASMLRDQDQVDLPEVSEPDLARHYVAAQPAQLGGGHWLSTRSARAP